MKKFKPLIGFIIVILITIALFSALIFLTTTMFVWGSKVGEGIYEKIVKSTINSFGGQINETLYRNQLKSEGGESLKIFLKNTFSLIFGILSSIVSLCIAIKFLAIVVRYFIFSLRG